MMRRCEEDRGGGGGEQGDFAVNLTASVFTRQLTCSPEYVSSISLLLLFIFAYAQRDMSGLLLSRVSACSSELFYRFRTSCPSEEVSVSGFSGSEDFRLLIFRVVTGLSFSPLAASDELSCSLRCAGRANGRSEGFLVFSNLTADIVTICAGALELRWSSRALNMPRYEVLRLQLSNSA